MRIVITGANRGIGLELTRQYLARGEQVEAAVREPESSPALRALAPAAGSRLRVHACDVTDDESVRHFARVLGPRGVDLLINNAGVMGKLQALEELDMADLLRTYDVNALGPLRVTRALLAPLREAAGKVVHVTSKMGSIGDNTSGGAYGYRMSKAALNMACKSMALDVASEGLLCVVVNPGWVKTDMGGAEAPTPVEVSVANLVRLIDRLEPAHGGRFFNHTGEEVPW
jgi:NAD(P)-dependent dehydrogenase (short-subunit alcohol dehydrogenase family)